VAARRHRPVSPTGLNVWEAAWCGADALVAVVSDGPSEDTWYTARLSSIDVDSGAERTLMRSEVQLGLPCASPSGRRVALVQAVCSDRQLVAGDVIALDPATGAVERLDTSGVDVTSLEWRDEDHLVFAGIRGLQTCVGELALSSGTVSEIWASDETCGAIYPEVGSTDPAGIALLLHSQVRPPEVAVVRDGRERTVFSVPAPDGAPVRAPSAPAMPTRWPAPDGLEIEGLLTVPDGPGPHPVVVDVHGGPVWTHLNRWDGISLHRLLLDRGCAVFRPNPRGSSGRGQAFAAMVDGDPGGADAQDIMSGIDMLVERGIADPDRIGVGGLSYGGFMSCWLVTQSHRFACAVAESPGTDWLSGHYTSNIATWVRRIVADEPTNVGGRYYTRNCVVAAHQTRTPVLLFAGSQDTCAPPGQAIEFFQALEENGVEAELVLYPEEGHGVHGMPATIDYLARAVGWFSRHLRLGAGGHPF
jgi:dipeptidyl aminopeptidase/acylaminoacyl peptidase